MFTLSFHSVNDWTLQPCGQTVSSSVLFQGALKVTACQAHFAVSVQGNVCVLKAVEHFLPCILMLEHTYPLLAEGRCFPPETPSTSHFLIQMKSCSVHGRELKRFCKTTSLLKMRWDDSTQFQLLTAICIPLGKMAASPQLAFILGEEVKRGKGL